MLLQRAEWANMTDLSFTLLSKAYEMSANITKWRGK